MIEGYGDREKYTCSVNSLDMGMVQYPLRDKCRPTDRTACARTRH